MFSMKTYAITTKYVVLIYDLEFICLNIVLRRTAVYFHLYK